MHRVLVDPGSAVDFLQLPTFKQIKLSSGILNLASMGHLKQHTHGP